ncbi:ImcF-related family protein, partial [Salmonella enterica]|uniref:ImcF-related family protein n=2 Tax=Gammaproteobacteria TaxID=1236 RepID=UPI0022B6C42B
LNETLVAQARQVLKAQPLAGVIYRLLREQGSELEPYRFAQHLDPQEQVFAGIDQPIPGFFTQQGYRQFFAVQGTRMVAAIVRDNWVLGEGTELSAMGLRQLMVELEQQYFSDYAQAWGAALAQVRLQENDSPREIAEQLAGLTSARSPLLQLLQQVRENTRFS